MKRTTIYLFILAFFLVGCSSNGSEEKNSKDIETKYTKEEFLYGFSDHKKYRANTKYEEIARNPEKFKDSLIIMSGQIGQIIDVDDEYQYIMTSDSNPDHIFIGHLLKDNPKNSDLRLLEGDEIVFYGLSKGLTKYETVNGTEKEVPDVIIHQYTHP